jgi:hypothetical protein
MAVRRFTQTPELFDYDGILVGVRKATTNEMQKVADLRAAYMKSLKSDVRYERENPSGLSPDGDSSLLIALQYYVSKTLCCDPENPNIAWFAADKAEQEALHKQGVEKDVPEDVPQEFHAIAFAIFGDVPNPYARLKDGTTPKYPTEPEKPAGAAEAAVPLSSETSEKTTESPSVDKSSESPSGSESTLSPESESGSTTSS